MPPPPARSTAARSRTTRSRPRTSRTTTSAAGTSAGARSPGATSPLNTLTGSGHQRDVARQGAKRGTGGQRRDGGPGYQRRQRRDCRGEQGQDFLTRHPEQHPHTPAPRLGTRLHPARGVRRRRAAQAERRHHPQQHAGRRASRQCRGPWNQHRHEKGELRCRRSPESIDGGKDRRRRHRHRGHDRRKRARGELLLRGRRRPSTRTSAASSGSAIG